MNGMYFGIIVDLINSKEYNQEQLISVHKDLVELLERINNSYNELILSNFTITLGDEFQGLTSSRNDIIDLIFYLYRELAKLGIKVRFGIGYGKMILPFQKEISIGSDGPAYHNARSAIDRAKDTKSTFCYFVNEDFNNLLDNVSNYYAEIYEKMNSLQRKSYCKLLNGQSKIDITKELGYNKSSLSRLSSGKAHKLDTYTELLKVLIKNCITNSL